MPSDLKPSIRIEAYSMDKVVFRRGLLFVVVLELLLGGNGYLTEVADIRLRVVLYIVSMVWVVFRLTLEPLRKIPYQIWILFILFIAVTALSTLVGLANGNKVSAIIAELKPLIYFPMILFFGLAIKNKSDVILVAQMIIICGILQATIYVLVLIAAHFEFISYTKIYLFLRESDEFIFRHNPNGAFVGFFFKGAFHLGVTILFLLFAPFKKSKMLALVVIIAVAYTLTRGIMAAVMLSVLAAIFLTKYKKKALAPLALVAFGVALQYNALLTESSRLQQTDPILSPLGFSIIQSAGDRSALRPGDSARIADLKTVWAESDSSMVLIGKGLGALIGDRERIEMTYVELLYKQGIPGLLLWIFLITINFSLFLRVKGRYKPLALSFFLATLFVYFATAANTFLTGSIGMSIVLISTSALLVLGKDDNKLKPSTVYEDTYSDGTYPVARSIKTSLAKID